MWQEVDAEDKLLGTIAPDAAADKIHRRVAVLLYNEDGQGLFWQARDGHWDLLSRPVRAEETSLQAAEGLLRELGLSANLQVAGGIFLLRDEDSSQTHLFMGPWDGAEPLEVEGVVAWGFYDMPPGAGAYRECARALLRALRKGHRTAIRLRKDMRKKHK